MYLNRMPRYKDTTIREIDAIEWYLNWQKSKSDSSEYETFNKSEAERIMYSHNEEWRRYVEKCIVNGEPYVDNEIFMYKEEVNDNG